MHILKENEKVKPFALFNLGFRPFFLLAGIFAIVSMLLWMGLYVFNARNWLPAELSPMLWHGHEMVFGYGMAVISGFLLTAIRNWTNIQTLYGNGLLVLCVLWIAARIAPFVGGEHALLLMAIADMLFMVFLSYELTKPVIKAKQWPQLAIVLKVILMVLANLAFYLGVMKIWPMEAIYWGLYSGFYLVISLIMLMGRRVIPFFIEKGVDGEANVKNWKWLDISSLILFLAFMVAEVFFEAPTWAEALATVLFLLHSIRLWGWHDKGIWKKPLLWVLYIGYAFVVLGFALKALTSTLALSPWLAVHAFAVGGIGIITAGMMSRVALGHTGRNVFDPPKTLNAVFALIIMGAMIRVFFPLFIPAAYYQWVIAASQIFWIAGFNLFVFIYAPMLIKARVDGTFG